MCQSCWTGDHGMPAVAGDDVLTAAWLIEHLYEDLGQGTGGPLHDVLDDMNVDGDDDGSISGTSHGQAAAWHGRFDYLWNGTFDRWARAGDRVDDARKLEIQHTCEAIIHLFDEMPVSHRAAAIAWAFGWVGAAMPDWSARHRNPEGRERAERYARELLAEVAGWWPSPEERYAPKAPKPCAVPCPPFTEVGPVVDGVIHPGPGMVFAQDAKITGPFERATVNDDGTATITGMPLLGDAPEGAPVFRDSTSYTVYADGSVETSRWTAEDVLRATTAPHVSVAEALDDPRQIRPTYPSRLASPTLSPTEASQHE